MVRVKGEENTVIAHLTDGSKSGLPLVEAHNSCVSNILYTKRVKMNQALLNLNISNICEAFE